MSQVAPPRVEMEVAVVLDVGNMMGLEEAGVATMAGRGMELFIAQNL